VGRVALVGRATVGEGGGGKQGRGRIPTIAPAVSDARTLFQVLSRNLPRIVAMALADF